MVSIRRLLDPAPQATQPKSFEQSSKLYRNQVSGVSMLWVISVRLVSIRFDFDTPSATQSKSFHSESTQPALTLSTTFPLRNLKVDPYEGKEVIAV